jgi:hypothetical protein
LAFVVAVAGSSPALTPGVNGSTKSGLHEGEKKRKRKTLDAVEVQPKGTHGNSLSSCVLNPYMPLCVPSCKNRKSPNS